MYLRSVACAMVIALLGGPAAAQSGPEDVPQRAGVISDAEVAKAIDALQNDPNLGNKRKSRVLRWDTEQKADDRDLDPSVPRWLRWIGELSAWFGESARVLMWIIVAMLIAVLVVWIIRIARGSSWEKGFRTATLAPTHVRDLDIRPESLPADIGQSALKLWTNGNRRAALSLLYRGLLSRLVHHHGVPIKHSSTEGECRALAVQCLPAASHEFVALLIRVWQGAVYGATEPGDETVRRLCENFASALAAGPTQPVAEISAGVPA